MRQRSSTAPPTLSRAASLLRPRSSRTLTRAKSGKAASQPLSDAELREKTLEVLGDMVRLRASLIDLQDCRRRFSDPTMSEAEVHELFMNGAAFQEALQALQSCQQQQRDLLANSARVSAVCPTEYPELLRLNVELMTAFSRLVTQPGSEPPPETIANTRDQPSFTGLI